MSSTSDPFDVPATAAGTDSKRAREIKVIALIAVAHFVSHVHIMLLPPLFGEVRDAFGGASNPEGTQPVNLVTADTPPMYLATGTGDPIVRMQNTEHLARALQARGTWVTTKFYEGFGHMEVVMAMGSLWRWRMPVLDDVTLFFNQFGAFPSGVPYIAVAPTPPDEVIEPMDDIIAQMDQLFQPVSK